MDAARLLWDDRSLYQRRFEKSAAALVAVARAVADDSRAPGASEFLALYETVAGAGAEEVRRVWRHPVAYHWVRRAIGLLAHRRGAPLSPFDRAYCTALGAADPSDALALHLRAFARFALALGLVARRDVALATPFDATLPLALPGTDLALTGAARATVCGVAAGAVELVRDGERVRLVPDAATAGSVRLERAPVVTVGDARIALDPQVFQLPGLGMPRDLAAPPGEPSPSSLVAEALATLRRFHPEAFAHFADSVRVVALKPVAQGDFGTLSNSELPGAFVVSVPSDPFALAADCIHECYHHRLFAIEETGAFFETDGEDAVDGELHYSPWRDAPRPLHGILHAVYVYLPVYRFWSASWRANAHDGARRAHVRDQLARIPFQLRIGVAQLRRRARLTERGRALVDAIAREVARVEDEAAALGATLDTPAVSLRANGVYQPVVALDDRRPLTVAETLLAHVRKCDRRGECAEEARALEAAVGPRAAR